MSIQHKLDNTNYNISFCTVCMNRLHHLQQTLPKNIHDNLPYQNLEFIVLDYNSTDGLKAWILTAMKPFIESGLLKYFRTEEPIYFDRSHSRNMAFKYASGDILCNVDADNYSGPGFASYLNDFFRANPNSFLTPDYTNRDAMGRLCLKRDDFLKVNGFNEKLSGYGFDDIDIYRRLESKRIKHDFIKSPIFLMVISHDHFERYCNEYVGKNIWKIYLAYLTPSYSEVIFLYKDEKYDRGRILDNELIAAKKAQQNENDNEIVLEGNWEKGDWKYEGEHIILFNKVVRNVLKPNNPKDLYLLESQAFYELTNRELFDQLVLIRTELDNREISQQYTGNETKLVNPCGYGNGFVNQITGTRG
jgi:glycosyltransferase involved in cell wall biosynthesis